MMFTLTDWAMRRTGKLHEHVPRMWNDLESDFVKNLDRVNADLRMLGLAEQTKA